jgi:predicted DCC family thiol-disulfide oxidoreductase YuxK
MSISQQTTPSKPHKARSAVAPSPLPAPRTKFLTYLRDAYSLDLRSLALFRIALGVMILIDLAMRTVDLNIFYTDWGVLPRGAYLDKFANPLRFSIHLMSGVWQFEAALFLIAAAFAVALILGVRTRLVTIVSWFLLVSLEMRNPAILQGGDVYFRLLTFWAMFLPLGALYSVDSALNTSPDPPQQDRFFSYAGLALLLQVAFVYAFSVAMKSGKEWRTEYSAVYYALSIEQMSTPVGRFLLHFPKLLPVLTRLSLIGEAVVPALLLCPVWSGPVRTFAVLAVMALHLAFGLSIRLGHFPFICFLAVLPLLPGWFWERTPIRRAFQRRKDNNGAAPGTGLRLYYDTTCPFCKKTIYALRTFLFLPEAQIFGAQDDPLTAGELRRHNSWILVDQQGHRFYKWEALAVIVSQSPIFSRLSQLMRIRPISRLGVRFYDWVASHREFLTKLVSLAEFRRRDFQQAWWAEALSVILIFYVLLWNIGTAMHRPVIPVQYQPIGWTLAIDQAWDMFAPYPLKYDGWYVIDGHLVNGTEVNVLEPGKPVSFDKPASIADMYKNERWRKYLMNLSLADFSDYRLYYGRYLCRSYNLRHPRGAADPEALNTFNIYFMSHNISLSGQPSQPAKDVLWTHYCFK